jgi:hypothetical protein
MYDATPLNEHMHLYHLHDSTLPNLPYDDSFHQRNRCALQHAAETGMSKEAATSSFNSLFMGFYQLNGTHYSVGKV